MALGTLDDGEDLLVRAALARGHWSRTDAEALGALIPDLRGAELQAVAARLYDAYGEAATTAEMEPPLF